jgi:four helix bundle protein
MTLSANHSHLSSAAPTRPQSYRDLIVWQRVVELGLELYQLTGQFPDCERFGLSQQIQRAAASAASNIAEGYARGSDRDYVRFLKMSRGSLCEIETQILFARELAYITPDQYTTTQSRIDDCQRVLFGLIRSIKVGD